MFGIGDVSLQGGPSLCHSPYQAGVQLGLTSRREIFLPLKTFLPAIEGHHVLIRSYNMTVVAFINRQVGLRLWYLYKMARHFLLWAQCNPCRAG